MLWLSFKIGKISHYKPQTISCCYCAWLGRYF